MLKIMMTISAFALLAYADGPVLKTGQTLEYKAGDDGTYQAGIARSYTRDDVNGTVTDNATNLEWQDNAVGSTMTHAAALTHCESLSLDGKTDWRLPSKHEYKSLVDYSRSNPAIDPTFQNTASYYYWSSTTYAGDATSAWGVGFYYGNGMQRSGFPVRSEDHANGRTYSFYVRCVRGGQIVSSQAPVSVPLSPIAKAVLALLFIFGASVFMRRRHVA